MLIDDGLLERQNGHWIATGDLASVAVPPTIQALLSARLDRLAPAERAVVERASVEGKVFHRGAVAELAPSEVRNDVGGHLQTLVRKELLRPDRSAVCRRRRLSLPPPPDQRCGVRGDAEGAAGRAARAFRLVARAHGRRARPRVRGDSRLPSRAGLPVSPVSSRHWTRRRALWEHEQASASPQQVSGRSRAATPRQRSACSTEHWECSPKRTRCGPSSICDLGLALSDRGRVPARGSRTVRGEGGSRGAERTGAGRNRDSAFDLESTDDRQYPDGRIQDGGQGVGSQARGAGTRRRPRGGVFLPRDAALAGPVGAPRGPKHWSERWPLPDKPETTRWLLAASHGFSSVRSGGRCPLRTGWLSATASSPRALTVTSRGSPASQGSPLHDGR